VAVSLGLFLPVIAGAQSARVSGYVRRADSREVIRYATVSSGDSIRAQTNADGLYFLRFTPGRHRIRARAIHNTFLGSGSYVSNTWRPTSAVLRVEDRKHPATQHLPETFRSSPNEWYRWEKDLRQNPDIDVLLSIDTVSFPLGTGPKPYEIWHSGYYPVVWTNKTYKMIYLNMGHNDIDYEHKYGAANKTLSYTLNNAMQDRLIIDGLLWLGDRDKKAPGSVR
jgi:hypothetical protein